MTLSGPGWRFRLFQIAVLVAAGLALHRGVGDGFALRTQSAGIGDRVVEAWDGTFRAIRRGVDRLAPPR